MFKKIRHIHFVGIGGSGMSGIAEVLLKLGYHVSGSDLVKGASSLYLEKAGATVYEGHAAANIKGADVVVTSTAISKSNPEVKAALKQGIPVIPRIEMLAEIARLKYTIAISGTHGKTTTTSLIGKIFQEGGLDPTVVVGGRLKAVGTGGVLGNGDFLVAEADESDGSFLKLTPTISVVTNIDNDHLDYYGTEEKLRQAFVEFASRTPFYGTCYLCLEDPGVKKILPQLNRRYKTYGFGDECNFQATGVKLDASGSHFDVHRSGQKLGTIRLPLSGKHNVLNALAAIAVGLHVDLPFDRIASALSRFEGVGRRIELKGEINGITVLDDYGHHPTEIKATLSAIRNRWPDRRLVVLFQPHRFSRTLLLAEEFGPSLKAAHKLFLLPIYPAGEKPIRGVNTQLIAKAIPKKNWTLVKNEDVLSHLEQELKKGDVLLTLGAGDVWKRGEEILKAWSRLAHRVAHALPAMASRIKSEEPLSKHCTWAIGGPAEVYVEIHTLDELKRLQQFCREERVPIFLLGWGSNVLLPDEGLRGCVVRLRGDFERVEFDTSRVKVGAGVHLPKLSRLCAEKGLAGVEALAGVPGTVGGALMTNAGTPRGVIGDVLRSVRILNADGTITYLSKEEIQFGYRTTSLSGRWIVGAELDLEPSPNGSVLEKMKAELSYREKTQPLGTKNVGSVFRNPPNDYAARLIEAVGLKGKMLGRVRFSPKHANFMENAGGASAKEALDLMRHAQQLVKDKFNIELIPEVIVVKQPEPL